MLLESRPIYSLRFWLIGSFAVALVSCGGSSGGGGDAPIDAAPPSPSPTAPAETPSDAPAPPAAETPKPPRESAERNSGAPSPEAKSCEDAWKSYASRYATGLSKTYKTTTKSTGVIYVAPEQTHVATERVVAASDDDVTFEKSERRIEPSETPEKTRSWKVTRVDRLASCIAAARDPSAPKVQTIETREEKVTVPAGTYTAIYTKTLTTGVEDGASYEHLAEVWSLKGSMDVVLKGVTLWKTTMNGQPYSRSVTTELQSLTLPQAL